MHILVTGGAGFIGSHTTVELLKAGHDVVLLDNFSNSKPEALRRTEELAGRPFTFHQVDLLDAPAVDEVFRRHPVDAVIHFAAFKAVGESVAQPLKYYHNNVSGTIVLCEAMVRHGVKTMVFSSSATVYGDPAEVPVTEEMPLSAVNPYGNTKLIMEQVFRDLYRADPSWNIALLRYFNPVGAHPSGRIGEDPNGIPNNLFPYITQVAVGKLAELRVFGGDYPTPDGTGVRDYIHVVDLARGHLQALEALKGRTGCVAYNLGTGRGHSVLEAIEAFKRASGRPIPYRIVERRPGDAATSFCDPSKALRELGWKTTLDLDDICRDAWRWQSQNPAGFPEG
ncbi:MAG: UDP-glucose 4-epimerase GalE [Gemmatimonadetes bacterium]|nr:UDP-glucose 4-epimerase GalE [Gemmatimonadota bacterium]MBK7715424.1 UDP-glucose 4-epimerase GalE [Gemmatimonadota bacterium]MBK7923289.1 UDP-glucose 4-epimerase GalE [Gemmatimonadota bacterium]MBK9066751.1 UDP-glucose 4-epimerase GalE [Gemmatimonadota bacterium]